MTQAAGARERAPEGPWTVSESDRTRSPFRLSWRPRDSLATDKPWRDWAFWALQGSVIGLYLARFGIEEAIGRGSIANGADFTTLAVFVWPVLYAAVTFGPTAGTFTTALVAALSVPRLISFAQSLKTASLLSESVQVLILSVIGLVVGRRVAAERVARLQADDARRAHLAAEARYRGLFRTNSAPILLIDSSGKLVESNAAASSIFGQTSTTQNGSSHVDLVELVGADTARRLLEMPRRTAGSVMTATTPDTLPDGEPAPNSESGGSDASDAVVVRVDVNGAPLMYRGGRDPAGRRFRARSCPTGAARRDHRDAPPAVDGGLRGSSNERAGRRAPPPRARAARWSVTGSRAPVPTNR